MSELNEAVETDETELPEQEEQPEEKQKRKLLKRKMDAGDWIRLAGILASVGFAIWLTVVFKQKFGEITASGQSGTFLENMLASGLSLKDYIVTNYPRTGLLVLLFLQFMQVIVSAIPSSLTSFASGMVLGLPMGLLVSSLGSLIGTVVTFYLTRLLGRKMLTLFISKKNIEQAEKMLAGNTSTLVLFILFVLPTPKDLFAFFYGLTNMKAWKFFLIATVGRIPGMFVTSYLGSHIEDRNWPVLIFFTVFGVLVTLLFVIFGNKIMALLKKKKAVEVEQELEQEEADA